MNQEQKARKVAEEIVVEVARPHAEQVSSPATVQPPPQPSGVVGEKHDQTLWRCQCGFLAIRTKSTGAPTYCCGCRTRGNYQDIALPCLRCAELERERDAIAGEKKIAVDCGLQLADERDNLKAKLADAEKARNKANNSSVEYLTALTGAERDVQIIKAGNRALKAKVEALEKALREIRDKELQCYCTPGSFIYGCNRCRIRKTIIDPVLANAALAGGK